METVRLSKSVRRVTQLKTDENGQVTPVILYQSSAQKKKRGSTGIRLIEQAVRRVANAQRALADSYIARHNTSNSKKKDGWVFDLPQNLTRASRTSVKKLRLNRMPKP